MESNSHSAENIAKLSGKVNKKNFKGMFMGMLVLIDKLTSFAARHLNVKTAQEIKLSCICCKIYLITGV